MRETLETFFLPCHNECCRFSKHSRISPWRTIFILYFTRFVILNQLAPSQGLCKAKRWRNGKSPRWRQIMEIPLAFIWHFNSEPLDRHFLTFMCIKGKGGMWNFALTKPSKKQHYIYQGHFLSIFWNSGHSKKDDIEERCKKIIVEKAEEKKALRLSSYSRRCTVSKASPCLEGTIYP